MVAHFWNNVVGSFGTFGLFLAALLLAGSVATAQTAAREFPPGRLAQWEELPPGKFRDRIGQLPDAARQRAFQWLRRFHFTEGDLPSLHADAEGGICFACNFTRPAPAASEPTSGSSPVISAAPVPVSPFPTNLIFHSRPGAPNVVYIEFSGMTVTNSAWTNEVGRTSIPAIAFDTDGNLSSFSDAEQTAIKRIWLRMAEDFAPFNVDVTTEKPATLNNRTAIVIITRNTDANGQPNPFSSAGGVAYVDVFNLSNFSIYRPAWVYHDNLSNDESYIAEAASHEIGHNLGLSHDGRTNGEEYYSGHGGTTFTNQISWGPLMGTGYNRNVSQWSKGDYYLANNTQDDLATIAAKVSYRADDHGNTIGTATPVVITGLTNIVATNPDNDPTNANPANKGVLATTNDVDVFSFVTGSGPVRINVNPWIMPAGYRGGNLDVRLELYNEAGTLLLTNNAPSLTTAIIQTNLPQGVYYLHIRNTGTGNPTSSTPTGYTAYGSLGQYFLSGYVTDPSGVVIPPTAELQITDLTQSSQTSHLFTVTYSDNVAISRATIDSNDLRITGPNGYDRAASLISINATGDGTPRVATYAAPAPNNSTWLPADNGTYVITLLSNQVADSEGAFAAAGTLGQFQAAIPVVLYSANMTTNPGWTLDPDWQYGTPNYSSGSSPTSGFTGTNIIAYNLSGNYPNNLSVKYATTPAINCSGASSLTLRFRRWLRTRSNDAVSIQASTNGSSWTTLWSSSSAISDSSWQAVQYPLPAGFAGSSSVRIRWSLASNNSQNAIGWNLDDVELLGAGTLDTAPPAASLSVANITTGGSPSHPCTVTYTDASGVKLSSLDSFDVLVTGPNGFSNLLQFIGTDLSSNGSPCAAAYAIAAPGGTWDATDNGTYQLTLQADQVEDTFNNPAPETLLGSFTVNIPTATPGNLGVTPLADLNASGPVGGPFSPVQIVYTLTNSGGTALNWTAEAAANWISFSDTNGTLAAGAGTNLTVLINLNATALAAGNYTNVITFANNTSGLGNTTRNVTLSVLPKFELTVLSSNPAWGSVSPSNGLYTAGSSVAITAAPAPYYQFSHWTGDVASVTNPLTVTMTTNLTITAMFAEMLTANFPTPLAWLAAYGYTNDFELAVTQRGANDLLLWQSYLAGLDPTDPQSRLAIAVSPGITDGAWVLNWNTVSGRVYSVWCATNLLSGFAPLPGATNLPWTVNSVTNFSDGEASRVYRLEVWKP